MWRWQKEKFSLFRSETAASLTICFRFAHTRMDWCSRIPERYVNPHYPDANKVNLYRFASVFAKWINKTSEKSCETLLIQTVTPASLPLFQPNPAAPKLDTLWRSICLRLSEISPELFCVFCFSLLFSFCLCCFQFRNTIACWIWGHVAQTCHLLLSGGIFINTA